MRVVENHEVAMVFQILRKSPGVSAICAGRALLSIVRVCLAAGPNPKRRLGGKISQLVSFRRRGRQGALPNSRTFPVAPSAGRTGQGLFQAPAEHLLNRNIFHTADGFHRDRSDFSRGNTLKSCVIGAGCSRNRAETTPECYWENCATNQKPRRNLYQQQISNSL